MGRIFNSRQGSCQSIFKDPKGMLESDREATSANLTFSHSFMIDIADVVCSVYDHSESFNKESNTTSHGHLWIAHLMGVFPLFQNSGRRAR